MSSQLKQLIEQAPAGFLPRVYYGLQRGDQKYRFVDNTYLNVTLEGNIGDAYELYNNDETETYIPAIGVKTSDTQIQIVIQGDYNLNATEFSVINMRTGAKTPVTIEGSLSLQAASYLGEYVAAANKEKQITVLHDLASGKDNVIFASLDLNNDETYNWVIIGSYVNGVDGFSVFAVNSATIANVLTMAKLNDLLIAGETFKYNEINFNTGDLNLITSLTPLALQLRGNIRGAQGLQGIQGNPGADGANGLTPYIGSNGNWWIGDTDTTVRAEARDGVDGVDGQAFDIQSGLYSAPANVGNPNNLDPNGNTLTTLPTLPQTDISGKGYVVYDPITTPLEPYYDLYWANNGDTTWTIVHPFSGIKGQDGKDGYTPYIQNNVWYINGVSTGVQATGNTGATGATPNISVNATELPAGSAPTATRSGTDANPTITFGIPTGATGATGATPNISVSATELPAGSAPTATRSGTDENPTITFGIPKAGGEKQIYSYIFGGGGYSTETLTSGIYFNLGFKYKYTIDCGSAITLKINQKYRVIIKTNTNKYFVAIDIILGSQYISQTYPISTGFGVFNDGYGVALGIFNIVPALGNNNTKIELYLNNKRSNGDNGYIGDGGYMSRIEFYEILEDTITT